jgi:putative membrane protein
MMHGFGFDGWGMFWGGGLLMILFWIGIIGLILWGLKSLLTSERALQRPSHLPSSPLEIVQARYARGEISRDEYLALVADLQSTDDIVRYSKEKRSEF